MSESTTTTPDGITVRIYRYSFRGGYYATADKDERPVATSGVYFGRGGKDKAVAAAIHQARTGEPHPTDAGCPG